MNFYKQAIAELMESRGVPAHTVAPLLTTPPANVPGHLSLPCFHFAKSLKKAPAVIAKELAAELRMPEGIDKAEPVNGYLNFFLNPQHFSRKILGQINGESNQFGTCEIGKGKVVVIDFSSPNMGKELAFHHLRGTMLGNSLARILKFCGYAVHRVNHLGDWGTSYGKLISMYLKEGFSTDDEVLEKITIEELNRLYQSFAREAQKNPEIEEEARAAFLKLEKGSGLHRKLWRAFRETTLKELNRLYAILGVSFDHYLGESEYTDPSANLLRELKDRKILVPSQGAWIVDLEKQGLTPLMMEKSDGSTLYATRDICAAIERKNRFNFYKNLYVVDNGQSLHFNQFFTVLKLMGHEWHSDCVHIPFGLVLNKNEKGQWEKGKTRAGHSSLLKDVLREAAKRIEATIDQKNPELKDKNSVAEKIAVGALIFNDLKNKRAHDVKFEWEKILSFEGDTGPYIVNAYVRLSSILRKSRDGGRSETKPDFDEEKLNFDYLKDATAQNLIQILAYFPDKVLGAVENFEPYHLGQFALQTAESAHQFLHFCRVLGSPEEYERLFLVHCTRTVLANTLTLLGIPIVESM